MLQTDLLCVVLAGFLCTVICHSNTPPFPQGDQQQQPHLHNQQEQQFQPKEHQVQQIQQQFQQNQQQFQQNQQPMHQQNEQYPRPNHNLQFQASKFHDKKHVMDQDHLNEHLDGVVKKDEDMSPEEMQFHYFKVHDYDNNNMLDGLELMSALTHFHKDEVDPNDPNGLSDEEISGLIDEIMKEDDLNNDGYIDYAEFVNSQQRDDA